MIEKQPLIDRVLSTFQNDLKSDYLKYYNHAHRVFYFADKLSNPNSVDVDKLAVAAAFHDLGIWTAQTFDYLEPSLKLAKDFLSSENKPEISDEICLIIDNHHKLMPFEGNILVESFRQADLLDLTFGVYRFGLPRDLVNEVYRRFPNCGFQRFIAGKIFHNTLRRPLNPLPMVRF